MENLASLRKKLKKSSPLLCDDLVGFSNQNNSCYLDSVLFCLFSDPHPLIQQQLLLSPQRNKTIQDFQKMFLQITLSFRQQHSFQTCQSFRSLLRVHKNDPLIKNWSDFHSDDQHEALEFLQFLFSLFGLNGEKKNGTIMQKKMRFGVFTPPAKSPQHIQWFPFFTRTDNKSSLIYVIPYLQFKKPHRKLEQMMVMQEESFDLTQASYKKCFVNASEEIQRLTHFTDFLVVAVQREDPRTMQVKHYKVEIPESLTDSTGKILYIDAVILHVGESVDSGHYVCFKRCQDVWFYYNDFSRTVEEISSWEKVKKFKAYQSSKVATHGVLFFYNHIL